MKRIWWMTVLACICLVGCDHKETTKDAKTEQTTAKSEAVTVKTQVFDLEMTNGQTQRQTVVYKGDDIQKLTLVNTIDPTEEMTAAISEVGIEETKRLMEESMSKDEAYQQLDGISGLQYELQIGQNNQLLFVFTLDVPHLDAEKLGQTDIFKGSGLSDISTLTAEQYLKRLESYGAKPVTP